MALFRCSSGDSGGGSIDLEQYYYDKVYNNPNVSTYYDMTVNSGNVTITKGRFAIDTVDEKVYVYYDIIGAKTVKSDTQAGSQALTSNSVPSTYYASSAYSTKLNGITLIDAYNSTDTQCFIYVNTTTQKLNLARYGVKLNRQYKGYGEWSYHIQTNT